MRQDEDDRLVERYVTYTVEMDGELVVFENVPARVDPETGERFYSPQTVERLQALIQARPEPHRVARTPVYHFAA